MRKKKIKKLTLYEEKLIPSQPEGTSIEEGFLVKSNSIIGLITSGIVETANEGFLHVEKTVNYETE